MASSSVVAARGSGGGGGGGSEAMVAAESADGRPEAGATYTVEVREKKGWFRSAIPTRLPTAVAILCAVLNCLAPGIGTLVSSPFSFGATTLSAGEKRRNFAINVLAGFLQLITAVVIVGWCWSIVWAIEYLELIRNRRRK